MPREPYPSQIPPSPKPKPKQVGPKMPTPKPKKPVYEFKDKRWTKAAATPKPKTPPAKEVAMGIMGSTEVQAKARQQKALDDMRKRGMLRKKQG